jgi:hypothetical protein
LRAHARLDGKGASAKITDWDNAESRVSWDFHAPKVGAFLVKADIANSGGGKLTFALDQKPVSATIPPTTSERTIELGTLHVAQPGDYTLELKPERNNWKGFDLRGVTLVPVQR